MAGTAAIALIGTAGAGAAPAHSGPVTFSSVSENNGKTLDVVTGVIVDHGSDHSIGQTTTQKIVLSKGTFEVASAKLNKSFKFKLDKQACDAVGAGSAANLAIFHGTGAYAGITGSISVTATFNQISPIVNGTCNVNKTLASTSAFIGTGHVSY